MVRLLEYLALSHPDISFRFISNNQNKLHTSGNMNLKDIIYNVYGRDITNNLYEISGKSQDIEASGFIGKPMVVQETGHMRIIISTADISRAVL